jgi:hypothetical protein
MSFSEESAREERLIEEAYLLALQGVAEALIQHLGQLGEAWISTPRWRWRKRRRLDHLNDVVSDLYLAIGTHAREQEAAARAARQ